jgi:hypothetical protein
MMAIELITVSALCGPEALKMGCGQYHHPGDLARMVVMPSAHSSSVAGALLCQVGLESQGQDGYDRKGTGQSA